MASLRRDDATNALPVLTRRRGLLFSFLLPFVGLYTEPQRKKEKKEETKNRPRFAAPTLLKRKKRRFDHTFEPRWRQPEWPGRHGFTGEKVHFNSLLSFLPEIRVIVICSWNEKIVEQSGTRAAGILCVKGKSKNVPVLKSLCVLKNF